MAVGQTATGQRSDRYHVEIRRGDAWNHIHPPAWQHTEDLDTARTYATEVKQDEGGEVRIIRTVSLTATTFATGKVSSGDILTEVVDR